MVLRRPSLFKTYPSIPPGTFCSRALQPCCVSTSKIWIQNRFGVKDGGKNCWQRCLTLMRSLSPCRPSERQPECKMGKKDDGDGTDPLIRWTWGGLRTESPLCCPGWNFVLEKCLTFSNPNCTQWGVSSSPLPTGLVSALTPGLRRGAGVWRFGEGINRMAACLLDGVAEVTLS